MLFLWFCLICTFTLIKKFLSTFTLLKKKKKKKLLSQYFLVYNNITLELAFCTNLCQKLLLFNVSLTYIMNYNYRFFLFFLN